MYIYMYIYTYAYIHISIRIYFGSSAICVKLFDPFSQLFLAFRLVLLLSEEDHDVLNRATCRREERHRPVWTGCLSAPSRHHCC